MLPILKQQFPTAKISVLVKPYTREIVENHSCVDEVLLYDEQESFFSFLKKIKQEKFDIAIFPYPRVKIAVAIFFAKIPIRIGTGYRWYSFFFNKKWYEHRKDAKKHEVEYNLNLLQTLEIKNTTTPQFEFFISPNAQKKVEEILQQNNIHSTEKFIILHPGSGGSARDWSEENFAQLGDIIVEKLKIKIIITGGKGEEELVKRVSQKMKQPSLQLVNIFSIMELGALLQKAKIFIANSTGPLHLAAILGTPVIGFYPPIQQCSPVRWGPVTEKKKIFLADAQQCSVCQGKPCQSNKCMEQITVEQVLQSIKELL